MKKVIVLLVFLILFICSYSNPFSDVPEDHWAYEAVRELISLGYLGNYPDGSFKGQNTVTRYEMAVTVAKMLDKVRDVQSSGGFIDAREAATLRKLSTEYRDELDSLGIRVGNLEDRVSTLEEKQKEIQQEAGQFRIYGSYFYEQNYDVQESGFNDSNRGFTDPFHKVTLEMLSKPSEQSQFYMKMENSMTDIGSPPELVGTDEISYNDQNKLAIDSANYSFNAPKANMRFFFREGFSGLDDPVSLLSAPWHSGIGIDTGSGMEASGNLDGDTSYFLTAFRLKSSPGETYNDYLGARTRYTVPEHIMPEASINIGASLVEGYLPHDPENPRARFHNVTGMDVEFSKSGDYSLTTNAALMETRNNVGTSTPDDVDEYKGFRMTTSYKKGPLSSNITYYNYDSGFGLHFIPDYNYSFRNTEFSGRSEWYYTWGNANQFGERFFDLTNTYDFSLGSGQNVHVNMGYLRLWWKENDGSDEWFNFDASRYNLDLYPTFSNNFKAEILNRFWKNPAPDVKGRYKNELKIFTTLSSLNGADFNLGVASEKNNDRKNLEGSARRENEFWTNMGFDATDTIFMNLGYNYKKEAHGWDDINSPSPDDVEAKEWWWTFETTTDISENYVMENSFYIKNAGAYNQDLERTKFIKTVLSASFSPNLRGRFGYWWREEDSGSFKQHTHADISYSGADGTSLSLVYSPSWSNGDNAFDNTNVHSLNTETFKRLRLQISSNF
ncbi:MAG: S-layer homology domain-containing protein [Candidatus Muiribacteriota bacterium]